MIVMYRALSKRFEQFESIHQLSLRAALISFIIIIVVMLGFIITQDHAWSEIGLGLFILLFLLNFFFITVVTINMIMRRNGWLETIFTIYVLLLNLPLTIGLLYLNQYLNSK